VHDTRDPKRPVTWYARYGALSSSASGVPQLILQQGLRQESSQQQVNMLEFASYNLDLASQIGASQITTRAPEVEEGGLHQVWQEATAATTPPNRAAELKAEVIKRLTWPWLPVPLVFLAAAALLHPPRRKQGSLRGAVLAGALGVTCIAGQFGWLVVAQGGQMVGYMGLVAWPIFMVAVAYGVWLYGQQ
jgi:lipopolysaccharide export LptBFGC system permease protein LptF